MTLQEKRETIRLVIGTDLYTDILDWYKRNGPTGSILLNLLEYEVYGNNKELSKRDALEWICKNFGEPNTTNETLAVTPKGNKVNIMYPSFPDNNYGRKTKYTGMNPTQKESTTAAIKRKSFIVFSLMKRAGWPITLFKRKNTDLYSVFMRDSVSSIMSGFEKYKDDEEIRLKGKRAFYFKDGSYYHLYSVSPQDFDEVMEIVNFLGIKTKVVV